MHHDFVCMWGGVGSHPWLLSVGALTCTHAGLQAGPPPPTCRDGVSQTSRGMSRLARSHRVVLLCGSPSGTSRLVRKRKSSSCPARYRTRGGRDGVPLPPPSPLAPRPRAATHARRLAFAALQLDGRQASATAAARGPRAPHSRAPSTSRDATQARTLPPVAG